MSKKSNNIEETIEMIDAKINHIEDATLDNRDLILKLVKQGNQIVEFLSKIEIEQPTDGFEVSLEDLSTSNSNISKEADINNSKHLSDLIKEFMNRHKILKEFEKELKKYKKDITPGIIGES